MWLRFVGTTALVLLLIWFVKPISFWKSLFVSHTNQSKVMRLDLLRAPNGEHVMQLLNGTILYLNETTANLTVVTVLTNSSTSPSIAVQYDWNNSTTAEPQAPYPLCGWNEDGGYRDCANLQQQGLHLISVSVEPGIPSYHVFFTIVNGSSPPSLSTSPPPPALNPPSLVPRRVPAGLKSPPPRSGNGKGGFSAPDAMGGTLTSAAPLSVVESALANYPPTQPPHRPTAVPSRLAATIRSVPQPFNNTTVSAGASSSSSRNGTSRPSHSNSTSSTRIQPPQTQQPKNVNESANAATQQAKTNAPTFVATNNTTNSPSRATVTSSSNTKNEASSASPSSRLTEGQNDSMGNETPPQSEPLQDIGTPTAKPPTLSPQSFSPRLPSTKALTWEPSGTANVPTVDQTPTGTETKEPRLATTVTPATTPSRPLSSSRPKAAPASQAPQYQADAPMRPKVDNPILQSTPSPSLAGNIPLSTTPETWAPGTGSPSAPLVSFPDIPTTASPVTIAAPLAASNSPSVSTSSATQVPVASNDPKSTSTPTRPNTAPIGGLRTKAPISVVATTKGPKLMKTKMPTTEPPSDTDPMPNPISQSPSRTSGSKAPNRMPLAASPPRTNFPVVRVPMPSALPVPVTQSPPRGSSEPERTIGPVTQARATDLPSSTPTINRTRPSATIAPIVQSPSGIAASPANIPRPILSPETQATNEPNVISTTPKSLPVLVPSAKSTNTPSDDGTSPKSMKSKAPKAPSAIAPATNRDPPTPSLTMSPLSKARGTAAPVVKLPVGTTGPPVVSEPSGAVTAPISDGRTTSPLASTSPVETVDAPGTKTPQGPAETIEPVVPAPATSSPRPMSTVTVTVSPNTISPVNDAPDTESPVRESPSMKSPETVATPPSSPAPIFTSSITRAPRTFSPATTTPNVKWTATMSPNMEAPVPNTLATNSSESKSPVDGFPLTSSPLTTFPTTKASPTKSLAPQPPDTLAPSKSPVLKNLLTNSPLTMPPEAKGPASDSATTSPIFNPPQPISPGASDPSSFIPTRESTIAPFSTTTPVKLPMPSKTPEVANPIANVPRTNRPVSKSPTGASPASKAPMSTASPSGAPVTGSPTAMALLSNAPAATAPRNAPVARLTVPPSSTAPFKNPTSAAPISTAPETKAPYTQAPVMRIPLTKTPLTPATSVPVSKSPVRTTSSPRTKSPPTGSPQTKAPSSTSPRTSSPLTRAPVTAAPFPIAPKPASAAPISTAPKTKDPTTPAPATRMPLTQAPRTKSPATSVPVSKSPVRTTSSPRTKSPLTGSPQTKAPVTTSPRTRSPLTRAPVTVAPFTIAPKPASAAPISTAPKTKDPTIPAPATRMPSSKAPLTKTVEPIGRPVLFSLSPLTSPDLGGAILTVKGQNLGDATGVRFGPAILIIGNFTIVDSETISFKTPGPVLGTPTRVSVIGPRGESNAVFTYKILPNTKAPVNIAPAPAAPPMDAILINAVIGGPYLAVDLDGDGFELVAVNAGQSNTSAPGSGSVSYTWQASGSVVGWGMATQLYLPVGDTNVTLTIVDSGGSTSTDETVIRVESIGYPVVFSLSPLSGPDTGGTTITIIGQDIGAATELRFGPVLFAIGSFTVIDSSTIIFATPGPAPLDKFMVSVIAPRGESNALSFEYVATNASVLPVTSAPVPWTPPKDATLINCGSTQNFTDGSGRLWLPDRYFSNGEVGSSTAAILGTSDDLLYQTYRQSFDFMDLRYSIPVQGGEYRITFHFAELAFEEDERRVFSIEINAGLGGVVIEEVDVFLEAGGKNQALTRTQEGIRAVEGQLTIVFSPIVGNPAVSAIELAYVGEHYARAVISGPFFAFDADGDGFEVVPVSADRSYTHGPNNILTSIVWTTGSTVLGWGLRTSLKLSVGDTNVRLTVGDSRGATDMAEAVIRVSSMAVFSLSPTQGPDAGGTTVTITGQNIGGATAVRCGPNTISMGNFTVVDSRTISFVTPTSGVGVPVNVSLVDHRGESNSTVFTYISTPAIAFDENLLMEIKDPTAVSFGPDGNLYVGSQSGSLSRVTLNDSYNAVIGIFTKSISTERCILGIAFNPLETPETADVSVYISTSKIYHSESQSTSGMAINGKVQKVNGANLNNIVDVVSGLPVSKIDHAINGLYFGDNGELYIGVGGNTNAGVPSAIMGIILENFFSAAVLVANLGRPSFNGVITYDSPDGGNPVTGIGPYGVEVFAAGLKNSYGLFMHSNGFIYATDNGPNRRYGRRSTGCGELDRIQGITEGDKLLLLKKGHFYGHANRKRGATDPRQCIWRSSNATSTADYTAPLMSMQSSMNGIIEFESDHFNGQMRGDLIISKYNDKLFRVILSPDGQSVNPFTNPPVVLDGDGGLAVTQGPDGSLFDARHFSGTVFSYKPNEPASSIMDIKSVFPRRGRLSGNSKLMIFGVNFSGSPTVKVGKNACTSVVLVSAKKIECILPAAAAPGRVDVSVAVGSVEDTFKLGYRYITGVPV